MLDDDDVFVVDAFTAYFNYTCPSCGGFREDGCSTCATYMQVFAEVDREMWQEGIADIHVETLRRINERNQNGR